jgi:hypothetical protein
MPKTEVTRFWMFGYGHFTLKASFVAGDASGAWWCLEGAASQHCLLLCGAFSAVFVEALRSQVEEQDREGCQTQEGGQQGVQNIHRCPGQEKDVRPPIAFRSNATRCAAIQPHGVCVCVCVCVCVSRHHARSSGRCGGERLKETQVYPKKFGMTVTQLHLEAAASMAQSMLHGGVMLLCASHGKSAMALRRHARTSGRILPGAGWLARIWQASCRRQRSQRSGQTLLWVEQLRLLSAGCGVPARACEPAGMFGAVVPAPVVAASAWGAHSAANSAEVQTRQLGGHSCVRKGATHLCQPSQ